MTHYCVVAVSISPSTLHSCPLASRGLVNCEPTSLQAVRIHIYQSSAMKNIRLVNSDRSVIYPACLETLACDKGWDNRADMLAARAILN